MRYDGYETNEKRAKKGISAGKMPYIVVVMVIVILIAHIIPYSVSEKPATRALVYLAVNQSEYTIRPIRMLGLT